MKKSIIVMTVIAASFLFGACTSTSINSPGASKPDTKLNFNKADIKVGPAVTGEATHTKLFGINFARLFTSFKGNVDDGSSVAASSIPVIGGLLAPAACTEATFNALQKAPEADFLMSPRVENKSSWMIIVSTQTCKVSAKTGSY